MTSKKESAKRLAIYLLIVFAASMLLIVFNKLLYHSDTAFYIFSTVFCWSPALACVITRAVTKEGFRDMKLHFNLKGNFKWYLLSLALPLVFVPIMELVPLVLNGHSEWLSAMTFSNIISGILMMSASACVGCVGLLGEELGWRGYMNQKMEPLFGTFGTCLIGGIVWGLWHFPIDIASYLNGYGTRSYMIETGFTRMLLLICLGVILMWVTKRTNSVFPAVVLHYTYNSTLAILDNMLEMGGMPQDFDPLAATDIISVVFRYLPLFVLAVIFMILLLHDRKSENSDGSIRCDAQ